MEPTEVVSINNAEHYKWGRASDGWHLLKQDDLSVIDEFLVVSAPKAHGDRIDM